MAITPLPTPPLRSDPTNFAARGDAFLGALPKFQVEANALAAAMNLNSTTDTSSSSVAIGTGAKTFVVSSGKSFQPGMYLVLADTSAPSTNSMFGQITAYSGTSLVMSIISVRGSGTKSSWVISQSSAGGAQAGPLASSGITGAAASGVNTDIISITGNAATATTSGNGSSNSFFTAGTGAPGTQNLIGTNCSGYSPAYLYNADFGWGLYSAEGGLILEYNRGTGKTKMSGNAATASHLLNSRTSWASGGNLVDVAGQIGWRNYGNNHTIFDASASLSPDGTTINNTNSEAAWSPTQPTLMGWNGSNTHGVRVDVSRYSESCSGNAATATTATTALDAIGYGQTWLNVFSSPGRTLGVTYYNTTGRSISVLATIGNATLNVQAVVNGQIVCTLAPNPQISPLSFIVPNGSSYSVVGTDIKTWVELR